MYHDDKTPAERAQSKHALGRTLTLGTGIALALASPAIAQENEQDTQAANPP